MSSRALAPARGGVAPARGTADARRGRASDQGALMVPAVGGAGGAGSGAAEPSGSARRRTACGTGARSCVKPGAVRGVDEMRGACAAWRMRGRDHSMVCFESLGGARPQPGATSRVPDSATWSVGTPAACRSCHGSYSDQSQPSCRASAGVGAAPPPSAAGASARMGWLSVRKFDQCLYDGPFIESMLAVSCMPISSLQMQKLPSPDSW